MGLFSKFVDVAVESVTKAETVRISYDTLSKIVTDAFIVGAEDDFLQKVQKTVKGGLFFPKELKSQNERYELYVGYMQRGALVGGGGKPAWVFDNEANKFYQLDKDNKWRKFYKAVKEAIKLEKYNRNR